LHPLSQHFLLIAWPDPPGGNSGCNDDPSFKDVKGYSCAGWSGYDCLGGGVSRLGYSESDLLAVRDSCRKSCNLCGASGRGDDNATDSGNRTLPGQLSGLAQILDPICGEDCLLQACQSIRDMGGACDVWVYGATSAAIFCLCAGAYCCGCSHGLLGCALRYSRCCTRYCRRWRPGGRTPGKGETDSHLEDDDTIFRRRALTIDDGENYFEDEEEEDAAIVIQKHVRGMQGRRRANALAEEREMKKIDREIEELEKQETFKLEEEAQNVAAVSIQRRVRGMRGRQGVAEIKEKSEAASMRLELGMHISKAGEEGSHERAVFRIQIVRELAMAAGVKKQFFQIKRISAGSILVDFEICPSNDPQEHSAHNPTLVALDLEKQGGNPNSVLRSRSLMVKLIRLYIPTRQELERSERRLQQEERALSIVAAASKRVEKEARQKASSKQARASDVVYEDVQPTRAPREAYGDKSARQNSVLDWHEGTENGGNIAEERKKVGNVVAERLKELRASKAAIVSAARPQGTSQALGSVADKLSKLKESKAGKAKNASAAEKVLRQIASQVEVVEHRRAHTHSSPSDHEGHYSFDAEESSHAPSSRSPIPVYVSDEQEDVGVSHARAGAPALLRGNVGRQHATRGSPGGDDSSV